MDGDGEAVVGVFRERRSPPPLDARRGEQNVIGVSVLKQKKKVCCGAHHREERFCAPVLHVSKHRKAADTSSGLEAKILNMEGARKGGGKGEVFRRGVIDERESARVCVWCGAGACTMTACFPSEWAPPSQKISSL